MPYVNKNKTRTLGNLPKKIDLEYPLKSLQFPSRMENPSFTSHKIEIYSLVKKLAHS